MLLDPIPIKTPLPDMRELKEDSKNCRRFGPCGIGKKALYLGGRFLDRRYYLPWRDIRRVFKRVAMSSGGFSGKGLFGSLSFLVVEYGRGEERECPFKIESDVDRLLAVIEEEHPEIPTHSAKAEVKLARKKAEEEARYLKNPGKEASSAVEALISDRDYLMERASISDALSSAAKGKRIADRMPLPYKIFAAVLAACGVLSALFGLLGLVSGQNSFAVYFLLGGAAAFLMALSTRALPGQEGSRKKADLAYAEAVSNMQDYLKCRQGFSVPPEYAHPVVLTRMIRVIREGRASSKEASLRVVEEDLMKLNSSVTVSKSEYDEVVVIKPLFLVRLSL